MHVFVNIATIFAFIFGSKLIEYFGFIRGFFVIIFGLYCASLLMVLGKLLSLYSMRIYSKTKNLLYLQLIMFTFFSYGKTILLCLLSMLITINQMNEVDRSYPAYSMTEKWEGHSLKVPHSNKSGGALLNVFA